MSDRPDVQISTAMTASDAVSSADPLPIWFTDFLNDRQARKLSAHTIKAYSQDFNAIATVLTNGAPATMSVSDITRDSMRQAFATYAFAREPASIRRCWSTWNVLCTFLYAGEQIASNPMLFVGRPKLPKTLPRALPRPVVDSLLQTVSEDMGSPRASDWAERDLALMLCALLAGLRADELRQLNLGDIRTVNDGSAVIRVRGKGGKERSIPIEAGLVSIINAYLDSRASKFPDTVKHKIPMGVSGLARWPTNSPLFVGRGGERITRGTLQSRIKRAFKRAGPDAQPVRGALVHSLRHTYATELASSNVSVYTLMKLLGHESMTTSQRYVTAAGTETRRAASRNPLYGLIDASD